jgi:large conductance mechanosensitive channel
MLLHRADHRVYGPLRRHNPSTKETKMGWMKEFGDFINRGNVIDLAVGIVIGAAFTAIVNSFVNDLLMPLIGVVTGGVDFSGLAIEVGNATVAYGNFIQAVFNFLIIAFAVFWLIRTVNQINRREKEKPAEPAAPPPDVKLLMEIRDLLQAQTTGAQPSMSSMPSSEKGKPV